MGEVTITSEELQAMLDKACERGAEAAVAQIMDLFGVDNDRQGRDALRSFGKLAMRLSRFGNEVECQGIKGAATWFWRIVGFTILGGVAWAAYRCGLLPGIVTK